MAKVDAPSGLQLIASGGREPRRVRRQTAANCGIMASGDCYTVSNNVISRATANPNGVIEALEVQPLSGPVSHDYVPANTQLWVIGIEDADAEFVVQMTTGDTLADSDFDSGAQVDIVDGTPCLVPVHSIQEVTTKSVAGDLKLVRLVDSPDNSLGEHSKVVVKLLAANVV
jgi:hypothetical protein